ncbi:MAG: squalene synthase HpnC, partial [Pseudomonadota bacterium]|nr:squalene synthase HpnC [Pseudomonadota bacterium]
NFPVASILCPPRIRPAVVAIYRFARTADDLADEGIVPAEKRLADLAAYRADLQAIASGRRPSARWPEVFRPLRGVISAHALPTGLLTDLLSAFEQDVVKHTYADRTELLEYCRRSANPIGRLLLHLYGVQRAQALQQADAVCTALQLVNFWQDLGVDVGRGRLYVPLVDCAHHGVDPAELQRGRDSPEAKTLSADMVAWARELMWRGAPLARSIAGSAGWELRLVVQGGLRILEKIEGDGFATLVRRPSLRWYDAPLLGWRALWMKTPASSSVRKAA